VSAPVLQIDVGNSGAKWRLVTQANVLERGKYVVDQPSSRRALLACTPAPTAIQVSSVAGAAAERELSLLLQSQWDIEPWFARSQAVTGALRNSYKNPARMGVDRWLAMLGARERCSGAFCVVDVGSALTIDLVAADGQHEGGYIIPGPELLERALLLDTDRVRFAEDADYELSPGRSTAEAVRHGVALAEVGAVSVALAATAVDGPISLFFCGGGGETLLQLVGQGGEFCPDLVFEGLEVMAAVDC